MSSPRSSLHRRLRRLAFVAGLLALPGLTLGEDIDLYTGAPINGGSPNLLIMLDNASAWDGAVSFTCPTTGVVSSNNSGKDVGFEQCSLYQAVTAIGTNPVLLGKINMGLMLFDPKSNGGWFRFPNVGRATDPGKLPLMDATGVANFQTVIKSMSKLHADVAMFSGATILGDGSAALILDVPQLLAIAQSGAQTVHEAA